LSVWSIQVLGGLRLTYEGRVVTTVNTNRQQALLAYLALHTGVLQSREHLASIFWPDSTDSQARTNLRQLLHHLRSALPDGGQFIEADSQNILWRSTADVAIDAADFEKAAARAEDAARLGDALSLKSTLEEAARLYAGDLMPSLYDEWAEIERRRLRQKYSDVLVQLTSTLDQASEWSAAIPYAERLLSLDTLCETSYQTLMRLHSLNGDRAAALQIYHQCATVLRRELDTEPGPATRQLRDQVTKQDIVTPDKSVLSTKSESTHLALIGRQQEFNKLLDAWKSAAQGHAYFVLVKGESGIGKTRLVEELSMWISRRGVSTVYARCYEAEGRLAYAPVADWLRSPVYQSVLANLPAPQLSECVRVLPELLVQHPDLPVPPPMSEGWQRHYFFEALARTILMGPRPVMLFIDDLQWCDQETTEWLHYLVRLEPDAPLLVAGTARIENWNERQALPLLFHDLNRLGCSMEISLEALSSKETASLATQVSDKQLDKEVIAELYRETQGNPLFVIESVRAGLPASSGQSWISSKSEADEASKSVVLPPKVHAILRSRLTQLSTAGQDLTSLAACIGRAFTADLLSAASHADEDTFVTLLDEIWQRRIITLQSDDLYDFSHDKLREVAYDELSPARRKLYHRRIAEAIAKVSATNTDAVSAELASHYEQAGLPALAIPLYYQAAKVSQMRYADIEVIAYLTRGLKLIESLPQDATHDQTKLDFLLALGVSLSATQGYAAPEVGRVYARARVLCEASSKDQHYFPVLWGSWVFHVVRSDLKVAREMASRLLQIADEARDAVQIAGAHFATGCTLFHLGEMRESLSHFQVAWSGYSASDKALHLTLSGPELGVFCLSYMAQILWLINDPEQSAECSRMALARADRLAHPFSIALAFDYASMLHQFRGEPPAAAEHARKAAVLCRQYGFSYYLAWTSIIHGWAVAETGDTETGVEEIQQGLTTLREQGAGLRGPYYQTLLAQAFARTGDIDAALKCLSDALLMREKTGECWSDPMIHALRSTLLHKKGDVPGAEQSRQRATLLSDQQKRR
jgi:DNA-binding SARP family transcriptional activator/predicted ATPase